MATENTKSFTKVIKGVKYTLPRVKDLPFDALDEIFELESKLQDSDKATQLQAARQLVRTLKETIPSVKEATKVLSMIEIVNLIKAWFLNEKKVTGSEVGK